MCVGAALPAGDSLREASQRHARVVAASLAALPRRRNAAAAGPEPWGAHPDDAGVGVVGAGGRWWRPCIQDDGGDDIAALTPGDSSHRRSGPGSKGARGVLSAVSWPWVTAWGSLEPSRRDGENAQKTGKNGEKMGEIRPKTREGAGITWRMFAVVPEAAATVR